MIYFLDGEDPENLFILVQHQVKCTGLLEDSDYQKNKKLKRKDCGLNMKYLLNLSGKAEFNYLVNILIYTMLSFLLMKLILLQKPLKIVKIRVVKF